MIICILSSGVQKYANKYKKGWEYEQTNDELKEYAIIFSLR